MIVDLGRIEAADRNGRKDRGQKTGAGVGQLVQNERAACNHGQDSEKAGAGGWLQHAVGRRDTRSGQRGNAERKRRRKLLEGLAVLRRSAEHTTELQSLMRNTYAVFCLKT